MTCEFVRYNGDAEVYLTFSKYYDDLEGPENITECLEFTYVLLVIHFMVGVAGTDSYYPTQRIWIHQWRDPSNEICQVGLARYLLNIEYRQGDHWKIRYTEAGLQDSPDYGAYLSDALIGYCHEENNELGEPLLAILDALLLPNYPHMLDPIMIPESPGMIWDDFILECAEGEVGPCCPGEPPPPGMPADYPSGVTFTWPDPPSPPGAVSKPWGYISPPDMPEYIPCNARTTRCVSGSLTPIAWHGGPDWPKSFSDQHVTVINDSDLYTVEWDEQGYDGWNGGPITWHHTVFYVKQSRCEAITMLIDGVWTTKEIAVYTGDPDLVIPIVPSFGGRSLGPIIWEIGTCTHNCYKWNMEIIFTSNGREPYPPGYKVRNYVTVECGGKPGLTFINEIPHITCGGDSLGPIGWAASTYSWFTVSLGRVECASS